MRLIDADALKEKAVHYSETEYHFDHDAVEMDDIDDAPTIDAVPVVRCKECVNWDRDWEPTMMRRNDGMEWHYCPMIDSSSHSDWFCADGERKTYDGSQDIG